MKQNNFAPEEGLAPINHPSLDCLHDVAVHGEVSEGVLLRLM